MRRLRVFGFLAYVHVPNAKRKKLDARAEAGFFAGYERDSKAWRVYVWRKGRSLCIKSRNVRFDEDQTVTLPRRQGLRRSDEELQHMALTGVDGVCDPSNESEFMPMPGPDPIPEPILGDEVMPPLEDSDDEDESSEETEDSDDDGQGPDGDGDSDGDDDDTVNDGDDGARGAGGGMHEQRYPQRERRAPDRYQPHAYAYAAGELPDEPTTPEEALGRPDAELWRQSMDAEWASLQGKGVLEKVDEVPRWKRVLPMKAVLKVKRDGGVQKYKTRLVVLGYLQRQGVDFTEVFAPTAQQASLRVLLAHAAEHDLELHQSDVATAFLNGELEDDEEVYVRMPAAFGGGTFRLLKALHGLKQAARVAHAKLRSVLVGMGFTASDADPCLFITGKGMQRVYVLVHVDDGLIIGAKKTIQAALAAIAGACDIKDIGEAVYFLGLEIHRDRTRGLLWLGQPICSVRSGAFRRGELQGSRDAAGGERAPWQGSGGVTHG